jgi:TolB-like protein
MMTAAVLLLSAVSLAGCGGMRATRYINPDYSFAFVERVAVLPFENFSSEPDAGVRATRLLITELLASGAVDVVEPGEVNAALNRLAGLATPPSSEHIIALGKSLKAQAVILGSVSQSETVRSGTVTIPVVTLDTHMVETETGSAVWAVTHTEKGAGLGAKFLGTASEPISETMRRCVKKIVHKLVG